MLGRHKIKRGCGKVKIDFFRIGKHCWSLSEESGEASAHMTRIRGPLSSILAVKLSCPFEAGVIRTFANLESN